MTRALVAAALVIGATAVVGLTAEPVTSSETAAVSAEPDSPTGVANAYLTALEERDMAAATNLFAPDARVFESGVDQGEWNHYLDDHLGPEMVSVKIFTIRRGDSQTIPDRRGSGSVILWPLELKITSDRGQIMRARTTATFVTRETESGYKIQHLHWSSAPLEADSH